MKARPLLSLPAAAGSRYGTDNTDETTDFLPAFLLSLLIVFSRGWDLAPRLPWRPINHGLHR